jgi:toxin HigB-1
MRTDSAFTPILCRRASSRSDEDRLVPRRTGENSRPGVRWRGVKPDIRPVARIHGIRVYSRPVIKSFGNAATEDFFHGRNSAAARKIPTDIRKRLETKLDAMDAAEELRDLGAMPGNRLEELSGNRKGFHSVRINDQWRIVFRWRASGPEEVEWTDYR